MVADYDPGGHVLDREPVRVASQENIRTVFVCLLLQYVSKMFSIYFSVRKLFNTEQTFT
jgi:hypothetical protein